MPDALPQFAAWSRTSMEQNLEILYARGAGT